MPSYISYKQSLQKSVDADDSNIESWITVRGNHIPVMKGQSKEEAVKAFIEKKGGGSTAKSYNTARSGIISKVGKMDKFQYPDEPDGDEDVRKEVGGELPYWNKKDGKYIFNPNVGFGSDYYENIEKSRDKYKTLGSGEFNSLEEAVKAIEENTFNGYADYYRQFSDKELEKEMSYLTEEEKAEVNKFLQK